MKGFGLSGMVGVVTGGCNGIGRVIVETLAQEGAQVVVFDLAVDAAPPAAALALAVDVSDEQAVAAGFAEVERRSRRTVVPRYQHQSHVARRMVIP